MMSCFEMMEMLGYIIEIDKKISKKNMNRLKRLEIKIKIDEMNKELKKILNDNGYWNKK